MDINIHSYGISSCVACVELEVNIDAGKPTEPLLLPPVGPAAADWWWSSGEGPLQPLWNAQSAALSHVEPPHQRRESHGRTGPQSRGRQSGVPLLNRCSCQ